MTAVTDATTVLETIIGRTLTSQQLSNVGAYFKEVDPYDLGSYTDPENPTNEEMAQLILGTLKEYTKDVVRKSGEHQETDNQQSTVIAAGNVAVANLT